MANGDLQDRLVVAFGNDFRKAETRDLEDAEHSAGRQGRGCALRWHTAFGRRTTFTSVFNPFRFECRPLLTIEQRTLQVDDTSPPDADDRDGDGEPFEPAKHESALSHG